jgi:hypothetical protein
MHVQETSRSSQNPELAPAPRHGRGVQHHVRRWADPVERRLHRRFRNATGRLNSDDGAATAEYAVATMAAVGFAGLLIIILRSDEVRAILTDLVRNALTLG